MKSLFTLIFVVLYCSSFGQIRTFLDGKKDKDKIEQVKNATTFFLLPSYIEKEQYQSILEEYWTYTKFEVLTTDDYNPNLKDLLKRPKLSRFENIDSPINFFSIGCVWMSNYHLPNAEIGFTNYSKKGDYNFSIAAIALFYNKYMPKTTKTMTGRLYAEPKSMHNFTLGLFQNYIQKLNSLLEEKKRYQPIREITGELAELRKNTLYIPQYHLDQMKITEQEFKTKVFKNYPFKTAVISQKELDKKILNKEKIYYFVWNQKGNHCHYWVTNSQTGEIIYKGYQGGLSSEKDVLNLTPSDLKKFISKL